MLRHLAIHNYALIENIEIDVSDGLTIITGETGAGKSILLGAISLLIGSRADTGMLHDKTTKCIVEAQFFIKAYALTGFFEKYNLDYFDLCTIRREINPAGVSRAFINDTPVNLTQLKELGNYLIDIHSQHQNISLNESEFQLSLLDVFAQHKQKLTEYKEKFLTYKKLKQQLVTLEDQDAQAKKDLDYFQFQFNELEEANLKSNDSKALELESETLTHAESIKKNLSAASFLLNYSENNALAALVEVKNLLSASAKHNLTIAEITQRVNSSYIELKDVVNELESLEQNIVFNPQRLEEIENKLNLIYRLQQKHRVNSLDELFQLQEELSSKIAGIGKLDEQLDATRKELIVIEKQLSVLAIELSKKRKSSSLMMEKQILNLLSDVGMPNASLSIQLTESPEFTQSGKDKIQFLFSANKGGALKELSKVASGGELSRLLLSLKSLLAQSAALPTIVFDEIDTGVSGDVANKVGQIMERMAKQMQVISITHLPQIAGKGNEHWLVYKEELKKKTHTHIKKLTPDERIHEIAQMLSSKSPTSAAISNARDLLKS